ncbi:alpha/beta hydrolase-fold protein [Actinomadura sp. ATCC 31491]|uniref:Alpha/beta hydrolase-fold protein n=1 Tax=Actinomadura luzonensis TaxID=2805427 RepID=A0ABT0G9B0_9ACTN|nr:alpha/beta hydrolase-fold protein [Actinomadura luzonensis]MCK2221185.1 alpha/beta hydrolase-fold protein [Actinomadura luzonensis]
MELTSGGLMVTVAGLALAALAATVWLWPRLGAAGWRAVTGRVGALVVCQALTLFALGLAVNAYFDFYGSWSDLLGTDTSTAPITPAGAGLQVLGTRDVPGGRVEQVVMPGPSTRLSEEAYVFLPAAFFKDRARRFPAIISLTGYPGDPRNLMTRLDLPGRLALAIGQGQVKPTILVMMRPSVVLPRDTECVNVPRGPQVQEYFARDVRRQMIDHFRVAPGRDSWGILGGSTGGYCALKIAMSHPDAFSAAVSLSGYYRTILDGTTGDLFRGDRRLADRNDLMWRLAHLPAPPISVLVTTSRRGEADYRSTERFLAAVRPPMRASSLILPSGGHNFNTWNRELPQALPWLAQQLTVEAPSPT